MSNDITSREVVQEAICDSTGEILTLNDNRYDWQRRRRGCVRLGQIYDSVHMDVQADKVRLCGTVLQYLVDREGSRALMGANFCQLRLCPLCIGRRARKMAWRLSKVLDLVEQQHGCMYIFLTLTVRNCPGDDLKATLQALTKGWNKLYQRREVKRAVKGWYRAMEITRNRKDGTYHPHIHAILAVDPSYFGADSATYLTHDRLVQLWRESMRLDYDPRVRIQVTRARGEQAGGRKAALEAAKYSVKDRDYIDPRLPLDEAGEVVRTYTEALDRRRMVAMGGVIRQAALEVDGVTDDSQETDLVHVDDESIREDLVVLVETYKWSFGVGDYVLTDLRPL